MADAPRDLKHWERLHELHPVVILGEGRKTPIHKNWPQRDVTLSEVQSAIRQNLNLGIRCDNLTVIDFDSKEPARKFFKKYRSVISVLVATKRGIHAYFKNCPDLGNKQTSQFDIRSGCGGFVVAVGSQVAGHTYHYAPGFDRWHDLSDFPLVLEKPNRSPMAIATGGDKCLRARQYLKEIEPATQGNRDNTCFRVACILVRFGLSADQAWPLLLEFNDRCHPPLENMKQLRRKLAEAERLK